MSFQGLAESGRLVRQERQRFEAQKWEVDLRQALDLPPDVRLERRTGIYEVPGFKFTRVRVDRVYRMDRVGAAGNAPSGARGTGQTPLLPAASPTLPGLAGGGDASATILPGGKTNPVVERASPTKAPVLSADAGLGLLDAGGGEVVWENAMVANHLMVQVEEGITRDRLQAALPTGAVVREPITMNGLYRVDVPAEGDKAVERAVLALTGLKGVVQFAEPDFLICGTDTTPNDPLFGSSTTTKQWHLGKIMAPRAWTVSKQPVAGTLNGVAKTATEIANMTVVAVVDTGVDYSHPELAANIWTNPNESGGGKEINYTDDDGNGRVDDWRGWNFVENNNRPTDDVGHGTHVAGIIGSAGNNASGACGVCWSVKILPLRIIKKMGTGTYGTYSTAVAALDYIKTLNRMGRRIAVANHSWGGSGYSLAMLNAMNNPVPTADPLPSGIKATFLASVNTFVASGNAAEVAKIKIGMTVTCPGIPSGTVITIVEGANLTLSNYTTLPKTDAVLSFVNPVRPKPYGVVHVAAAGNSRWNTDRLPVFPACLPCTYIVTVGASDGDDAVALWSGVAGSNYGRLNVDLFAPGSGIWSTFWKPAGTAGPPGFIAVPGSQTQGYVALSGTSMAAPQAAGALALLRMWQPDLSELQARQVIIDQVDIVEGLRSKCASGGRLNVAKVMDKLYQPVLVGSGGSTGGGATSITQALQATMSITGRLAMGFYHTLFVDQGEVWAWGINTWGQLGDGTTTNSARPTKIAGLSEVVMVTACQRNSYALKSDGTVWAWGCAPLVGNGYTSDSGRTVPEKIAGLTDVVWISASCLNSTGDGHVLAVRADGTVRSWGFNSHGQLGDGTKVQRYAPVAVTTATNVVQVSAGRFQSLALRKDGTAYAWGARSLGGPGNPLGDGPKSGDATSPIVIPGLSHVVGLASLNNGEALSLFLKDDGTVWKAGTDPLSYFFNQVIGQFDPRGYDVPVQQPGLSNIQVLAGSNHLVALDREGRLFTWGDGTYGALGTGSEEIRADPVEVHIPGGNPIIACAAGFCSSMVLDGEGQLWVAGWNAGGQLGLGKFPSKEYPTLMPALTDISAIGGGHGTCWARRSDGSFMTWGNYNFVDSSGKWIRSSFQTPTGYPNIANTSPQEMVGNYYYFLARCADGSLWSWGEASIFGSLGRGTENFRTREPLQVPGLTNIAAAVASYWFSMATDTSGNLYAWGLNSSGVFGVPYESEGTRGFPALVPGISSVTGIAAGRSSVIALKSDGTVWTWGNNSTGQLGDGTLNARHTPQQVEGISNAIQVAAIGTMDSATEVEYVAFFALTSDGSLYGWGSKGNWCASSDTTGNYTTPHLIYKPASGTILKFTVSTNSLSSGIVALLSDHTVVSWGDIGNFGRALDSTAASYEPAPVLGATDVVDIAQDGYDCFFLLKSDGTVWACGYDFKGSIGMNESWRDVFTPVVGFGGVSSTLSTLGTGSTTDSWYFQNFSTAEIMDTGISGDTASASGDGIPNLIKYALGLDPKQSYGASSLPSVRVEIIGGSAQSAGGAGGFGLFAAPTAVLAGGKRYLVMTVPRNGIHPDVDYVVEVSEDRVTWRSGDPYTVTTVDTADTLEVYSATSLDDVPQQYMRLRIVRHGVGTSEATAPLATPPLVPLLAFTSAGSVAAEGDGTVQISLSVTPAAPMEVTIPFTVEGTATPGSDYVLSTASVTFPAGATTANIAVQIVQDAVPEPAKTLTFILGQPPDGVRKGVPDVHALLIAGNSPQIGMSTPTVSQIVPLNAAVIWNAVVTGAPAPSLQWRKDGASIAGATGTSYSIPKVQLAHAGSYALRATNSVGTAQSPQAVLAVVDTNQRTLNLTANSSTTLTCSAAGAGISYQWTKDGAPLTNVAPFSGVQTKALTLTRMSTAESGSYACVVTQGANSLAGGLTTLRVIDAAPAIITPVALPEAVVSGVYGPFAIPVDPAISKAPASYAALGLPAGLVLNTATGVISGRPTVSKATPYVVTLTATNARGSSTTKANLKVNALPDGTVGTFHGFVQREPDLNDNLGGRLTLTTTATGTCSGTLVHGATAYPFSGGVLSASVGSLSPTCVINIPRPGLEALRLAFTVDSANNRLASATLGDGTYIASVQAWRNKWTSAVPATAYQGYYTLALKMPGGQPLLPQGDGYGSFTVSSTGTLNVTATLADGTTLTTGTFIGPLGEVLMHQPSTTADTVVGFVTITPGSAPGYTDSTLAGTVDWSRKQQVATQRTYRDAFGPVDLTVVGGRYVAPSTTAIVMGLLDRPDNAQVRFVSGGIDDSPPLPDITARIKPGGTVTPPLTVNNPRGTTLTVLPASGSFSGGFVLVDNNTVMPTTKVTRIVSYRGLIVSEAGVLRGYGHFLLPKLPSAGPPSTSTTTSPILSGQVVLEAAD